MNLEDFVKSLTNETRQVKDFDHTIAITIITDGLKDKDFTKSLTKKLPIVFVDPILREKKCTSTKEAKAMKYQSHNKITKKEKNEELSSRGGNPRQNC